MQRNDGGNFSNDAFARLLAQKLGSISVDDLKEQEQVPEDAMNTASMATIGRIAPKAPEASLEAAADAMVPETFAERIKQAAMKSGVQGPEGGLTNQASMYQQGALHQMNANERFQALKNALRKK